MTLITMKDVTRLTRIQCGYLSKMEMQGWIGDTWWHSWSWLRISPFPNLWWLGETSPPHDVLMHRGWRFGDGRFGDGLFFLHLVKTGTQAEYLEKKHGICRWFELFFAHLPLPSDVNMKLLANYVNQNDQTKPNPSGLPKEVYKPPALWYPP